MVAMHRAISPATARSSADTDSSAPGVSMTVTSGSPSSSARFIARRASRSAAGPMAVPGSLLGAVLTDQDARLTVQAGQRDHDGLVAFAFVGAAKAQGVGGAVAQQVPHPGTARLPGQCHRLPCGAGCERGGVASRQCRGLRCVEQDAQRPVDQLREQLCRDDGVDDALGCEVRPAELPVGTVCRVGPRTPLGQGSRREPRVQRPSHVPASPRRRRHPRWWGVAGGRGRAGRPPCVPDSTRDLDHLDECRCPFLHSGSARGSGGEQRQSFSGRATHRGGDATGCVAPIDPARNPNSFATTATGRPRTRPRPVTTASSVPALSRAARSSRR